MTISPPEVTVRPFQPGDEAHFQKLNEEWITRYFVVEPKDRASFADPQKTIVERGHILFAVRNGEVAGCCALLDMGNGQFEVAKMAVSEGHQGAGIGRRLLEEIIGTARGFSGKRLYLETNHVLVTAVRLYESVGFTHLPAERIMPSPYARADVYMELFL